MPSRMILSGYISLPSNIEGLSRDKLFTYEMLGLDQRVCGLDVMRLQMNEIGLIR